MQKTQNNKMPPLNLKVYQSPESSEKTTKKVKSGQIIKALRETKLHQIGSENLMQEESFKRSYKTIPFF